jgi:hypothetical protein
MGKFVPLQFTSVRRKRRWPQRREAATSAVTSAASTGMGKQRPQQRREARAGAAPAASRGRGRRRSRPEPRDKGDNGRAAMNGRGGGGCARGSPRGEGKRRGEDNSIWGNGLHTGDLWEGVGIPNRREPDTGCRCRAPNRQIPYRYGSGKRYREPLRIVLSLRFGRTQNI